MAALNSRSMFLFLGLLTVLVAGCGPKATTARVSGKVTMNGQVPPAGSSITFIPTNGKGSAAGSPLKDGAYSFDMAIGEARVEIRVPKSIPNPNPNAKGPGAGEPRVTETLPAKYNSASELKFEVKAGGNTKDWEVSATP